MLCTNFPIVNRSFWWPYHSQTSPQELVFVIDTASNSSPEELKMMQKNGAMGVSVGSEQF